ncbi:MAG: hypothetical protein ACKO96_22990 [Flammeovirgaceae bacterium]
MMVRTQIYLPPELLQEAKLYAKMEGINLSQYIRNALGFRKVKKPKKALKTVTLKDQKVTNAALNHNEIYDQK